MHDANSTMKSSENKLIKFSSKVDIRELKFFAFEKLPKNSPLRDVLLVEDDEMKADEFLIKIGLWLKLSRKKANDR